MTVAPASTSTSLIAAVSSSNSSVGRSAKSGNRAIQLASTTGIVPQEEAPERQVVTPCCSYPESPDNRAAPLRVTFLHAGQPTPAAANTTVQPTSGSSSSGGTFRTVLREKRGL